MYNKQPPLPALFIQIKNPLQNLLMADVTLNFFEDNRQGWGAGGVWEGRWRVVYEVH